MLVSRPLGPLLSRTMSSPLDFHIFRRPHTFGAVDEMAEHPAAGISSIVGGVAAVPVSAHDRISQSIVGRFTRCPPIRESRRRPCRVLVYQADVPDHVRAPLGPGARVRSISSRTRSGSLLRPWMTCTKPALSGSPLTSWVTSSLSRKVACPADSAGISAHHWTCSGRSRVCREASLDSKRAGLRRSSPDPEPTDRTWHAPDQGRVPGPAVPGRTSWLPLWVLIS